MKKIYLSLLLGFIGLLIAIHFSSHLSLGLKQALAWFIIPAFIAYFLSRQTFKRSILISLLLLILTALFLHGVRQYSFDWLFRFSDASSIRERAWTMVQAEPIFGLGLGNVGYFLGTQPANFYLSVWLNYGLFGLIGFLTLLINEWEIFPKFRACIAIFLILAWFMPLFGSVFWAMFFWVSQGVIWSTYEK